MAGSSWGRLGGGGGGEHPEELSVVADHFKQNGGNEMISGFKLELRRSTLAPLPPPDLRRDAIFLRSWLNVPRFCTPGRAGRRWRLLI